MRFVEHYNVWIHFHPDFILDSRVIKYINHILNKYPEYKNSNIDEYVNKPYHAQTLNNLIDLIHKKLKK